MRARLGAALLAGLLALSGSGPARAADNPITIGLGMALTGGLAPNGKAALLAMQASLAQIPPATDLLARAERDPRDFAALDGLGVRKLLGGDAADAMQHWLAILAADRGWNEGLARKRLLDAFRIVHDDALVSATRRKMSSLLF